MKLLSYILLPLSLLGLFSGCKNDVELNAPYKEIPSIYAVLNPFEEVNTIRINKVFLGEGDANVMAKVSDSVNYQPGELTVTLKSKKSALITFSETVVETSPGAFSTNQRVYTTKERIPAADMTGTVSSIPVYTLTVKNNKTGNVFTATASPVPVVNVVGIPYGDLKPPYLPPYDYYQGANYAYPDPPRVGDVDYVDYINRVSTIYFPLATNAEVYQLVISTHFYNDLGGGNKSYDYFDYVFDNKRTKDAAYITSSTLGSKYIKLNFRPVDYFFNAGIVLSKKNVSNAILGRRVYMMEYTITASTQEYLDYIEYAKPSLSFNQNKPLYSNFDNSAALGIFTFRSKISLKKWPSTSFVNAFSYNSNTCKFKFYDSNNILLGCQ